MSERLCKNCKHFKKRFGAVNFDVDYRATHVCESPNVNCYMEDDSIWAIMHDDDVLEVGPEFGCVHFESK